MSLSSRGSVFLVLCIVLVLCPAPAVAFGAGNIPGISTVEGQNWRHGDIEDMLKTVAFLKGHKWSTMMIKRVYFGNWLRDYSQAIDVGSVKGVPAPTIRILVWILSFLSFGYATGEFEVTEERLGVYRPEEHIDNPKDYADNEDARKYDPRLRGPIQKEELLIDPSTGMKNYIANDRGGWATSSGYIRYSITRSVHFGRVYTHGGGGSSGKEADLSEALRCLGQSLHCLEDWGAHTNYCELALIELGFRDVFPHVGTETMINLNGRRVYPLVTGTFGAVDFLHSMLGEANDHLSQSEIEEMDLALMNAQLATKGEGTRGFFGSGSNGGDDFLNLLSQIPGQGAGLASQARDLQAQSQAQEYQNETTRAPNQTFQGPPGSVGGPPGPGIPGMDPNFDAQKTIARIYPILEFRDKIVKSINATIAKIPGLEKLVETISEKITVFIMSLLAPFVRPIIEAVTKSLQDGSGAVVKSSADQQFVVWNDPHSSDPTHSMLSKDHFSNYLNPVGGRVATTILQYAAPRILYAWEHPGVPVDEVINDILNVFHHPTARNEHLEIHRNMFNTVKKWVDENPQRNSLNHILSSSSVKAGGNHKGGNPAVHSHGPDNSHSGFGGYGQAASTVWNKIQARDLGAMREIDSPSRGVSPAPPTPAGMFGYSSDPNAPSYGGGGGGGEPYLGTQPPGYSYDNAAPMPTSYQASGGGGYGGPQDQYQGGGGYGGGYGGAPQQSYGGPGGPGGYPPQQTGWDQRPQSQGWDQRPQSQGGWQQGPPPPQQGGWQQGPPQQQGGWQQGPPPPQQAGWQQGPPQGPPQGGYPGQGYPGQGGGYPGQGYSGGY
ncbi:hypothetical protein V497_08606 [Pseudogymnoascus sp. VKM F-4516 (FW-969)]|nr:hypothetical protein V497_08606 [Pseudogymnoascus sp. VKM F-4516 (FW-969)]